MSDEIEARDALGRSIRSGDYLAYSALRGMGVFRVREVRRKWGPPYALGVGVNTDRETPFSGGYDTPSRRKLIKLSGTVRIEPSPEVRALLADGEGDEG